MDGDKAGRSAVEVSDHNEHGPTVQAGDISTDTAIRLLTEQRRRTILRHLMNQPDGTARVDDLVDSVMAAETTQTVGQDEDRERIKLSIQGIHLPYLTEAGLITHVDGTERVRYRPDATIETLLQALDRISQ